jgi:hypothetical protein
MSGPKKKTNVTVRGAPTPDTHTTAVIHVVDKRESGATFDVAQAEVEIKGPAGTTAGKTNQAGNYKSGPFRAGTYDVVVKAKGMGPVPGKGKPVNLGPVTKKVTFLPNTKLPAGKTTNEVTIALARESPRIHVKVLELHGGSTRPLAGADVDVITVDQGQSDAKGELHTRGVVPGKYNVLVKMQGMFPQNQSGDAFFRQVEIVEGGVDFSTGSMDLFIEVILAKTKPTNIPPNTGNSVAIWASGTSSPHSCDPDPRLPSDTPKGQAGWDMGIKFSSFADLAKQLHGNREAHLDGGSPILDHQVSRLALVAHGAPGIVDVDQRTTGTQGQPIPAHAVSLTVARLGAYAAELDAIARALRNDSVVILASCQAGDGKEGEALLKALSRRWPTTFVVGLRSLAAVPNGNRKPGSILMFAGVRDTKYPNGAKAPGTVRDYENPKMIADLNALPWMSESSRHATVARDGNIIRRGQGATG